MKKLKIIDWHSGSLAPQKTMRSVSDSDKKFRQKFVILIFGFVRFVAEFRFSLKVLLRCRLPNPNLMKGLLNGGKKRETQKKKKKKKNLLSFLFLVSSLFPRSYVLDEPNVCEDPNIKGRWTDLEKVLGRGSPFAGEGFAPELPTVRALFSVFGFVFVFSQKKIKKKKQKKKKKKKKKKQKKTKNKKTKNKKFLFSRL